MSTHSLLCACLATVFLRGQAQTQATTQAPTPAAATYSLKFTPFEGQTITYRMTGTMEVQNGTSTLESKVAQKILKVDPDGTYSVQYDTLEGKVVVGGAEIQMPKSSTVTVFKPTGEAVSITGEHVDPTIMRSENLTMLKRPEGLVKPGDSWILSIKGDSGSKSPSVQGTFTFVGEETVGKYQTLKITSKVDEGDVPSPGSVISSFWINKVDGSIVKSECKYTSVTFPGGTAPLSGMFAMSRLDN